MAKQKSAAQSVMDRIRANRAKQPSLGAELRAMAREADKDVRATMHEVFFGQPERAGEQGTPLNPTPQIVTQELRQGSAPPMMEEYAARAKVPDKDRGPDR